MELENSNKKIFYSFLIFLVFFRNLTNCATIENDIATNEEIQKLPEVQGNSFYYFGFGSNMLTKRIHIQNPTAIKIGAGKLDNFRLDFYGSTARWNGAPATIVPEQNATTYGTLWSIDLSNLHDIDDQEGVFEHYYAPISVPVELLHNATTFTARAYHLVEQPVESLLTFKPENVPFERQPSKTYLQCLVKGAIETGLPNEYITWLQSLKHNNCTAADLEDALELKDIKLST